MKACRTIQKTELQRLMKEFEIVYDLVRIVEPHENKVVSWDEQGIKTEEMHPCFSVWEKDAVCDNCISLGACVEHRRMTKFEFKDEDIYSVVAFPFLVQDGKQEYMVSLELVNQVTNDMILQADGTNAIVEKIENLNKKIYRDSLTGLLNRRYFDERRFLYDMSYAIPKKFALLMIDVNRFKMINDRYGHMAGDEVLAAVAGTVKRSLRDTDEVIRVGGDEFLIVLKDCHETLVKEKLSQIRKAVGEITIASIDNTSLSVAMGMSYSESFDGTEEYLQAMYAEADVKMYANKKELAE